LHLDWPGLVNARDLGGLPVRDGHIRQGALIRSDSLTRLTDPDALREAGVARIVDLRRPGESVGRTRSPTTRCT
jgi:protein tyrosine/serine phosphatase